VDLEREYNAMMGRGAVLFIRTVTYHYVGRILDMDESFLLLECASWVASAEVRHGSLLANGLTQQTELEYIGSLYLNRSAIVDMTPWRHPLPTESQ
jgi:hypothetical protein